MDGGLYTDFAKSWTIWDIIKKISPYSLVKRIWILTNLRGCSLKKDLPHPFEILDFFCSKIPFLWHLYLEVYLMAYLNINTEFYFSRDFNPRNDGKLEKSSRRLLFSFVTRDGRWSEGKIKFRHHLSNFSQPQMIILKLIIFSRHDLFKKR